MKVSAGWEKLAGSLRDKRRYFAYRSRVKQLPAPYRSALEALERYLLCYGVLHRGDVIVAMHEDLADLFERAAADGTPIRAVVGEDPVAFAEDFLQNYSDGQWINRERARLNEAIDRAETQGAR